jgi:hypothetical protein
VDLYIHSPIRLHGIVLNWLSAGTTLPFFTFTLFSNTLSLCSFLNVREPSFAPIQNHRQNFSFVYSIFYFGHTHFNYTVAFTRLRMETLFYRDCFQNSICKNRLCLVKIGLKQEKLPSIYSLLTFVYKHMFPPKRNASLS